MSAYLTYENTAVFTPPWTLYQAGGIKGDPGQEGMPGTGNAVVCLCTESPSALFDGMIWVKGGTATPVYYTAVGGITVLTQTPPDISSQADGTIIITEA